PLPLTNFIPAVGIGVLALGLLEEDGLTALLGIAIGTIGLVIVGGVLVGTFDLLFG
ncbi:MAG: exopolysaccharide biosynthesis protein, partial [Rhodospirillaceae bacterium]|nr:exopolysaccharide biosynthesis protein [Rhodospirillaceae bacterium]